mmetsp:Transcript_50703/g.142571  ORF Transcript_50703/g.142571 Transcript_50703/m.142571 type:complete len:291 (+) Transcript_50703:460-1332(+)
MQRANVSSDRPAMPSKLDKLPCMVSQLHRSTLASCAIPLKLARSPPMCRQWERSSRVSCAMLESAPMSPTTVEFLATFLSFTPGLRWISLRATKSDNAEISPSRLLMPLRSTWYTLSSGRPWSTEDAPSRTRGPQFERSTWSTPWTFRTADTQATTSGLMPPVTLGLSGSFNERSRGLSTAPSSVRSKGPRSTPPIIRSVTKPSSSTVTPYMLRFTRPLVLSPPHCHTGLFSCHAATLLRCLPTRDLISSSRSRTRASCPAAELLPSPPPPLPTWASAAAAFSFVREASR